jgi:hypothetical protein
MRQGFPSYRKKASVRFIEFVRRAIVFAIAIGAVLSAPLFATPCGSSVPVGSITVFIFDGTTS